jgi:hypothetical protein
MNQTHTRTAPFLPTPVQWPDTSPDDPIQRTTRTTPHNLAYTPLIQAYEKDRIPKRLLAALQPYLDSPAFVPDAVGRVSHACKSMCMWVRAIGHYARVRETAAPLFDKVAAAAKEHAARQVALRTRRQQLQVLLDWHRRHHSAASPLFSARVLM